MFGPDVNVGHTLVAWYVTRSHDINLQYLVSSSST